MSSHKQVGGEKRERDMEKVQRMWEEWTPVRILSGFLLWFTLLGVLSFFFARSCVLSLLRLARARERKRFIYFLVLF
jgi:hypothetical protein